MAGQYGTRGYKLRSNIIYLTDLCSRWGDSHSESEMRADRRKGKKIEQGEWGLGLRPAGTMISDLEENTRGD